MPLRDAERSHFRLEAGPAGVRGDPHDPPGATRKMLELVVDEGGFSEIPAVAQEDERGGRSQSSTEPLGELRERVTDPGPAVRAVNPVADRRRGPSIPRPADGGGNLLEPRAEGEHAAPPRDRQKGVHEREEPRFVLPHRAADVPQEDEFGTRDPGSLVPQLEPFSTVPEALAHRVPEVNRTLWGARSPPPRERRKTTPESTGPVPHCPEPSR